ncbi:MAG: MBOAT family protein, partial [Candidatus Eremiobacteraeota bacterium]|nr:MBOAT family protein [Candidatus Eremiobacteraeota bacterium]
FKTIEFFVFALFFPTMVAGPIKRFQNFAPQLRRFAHVHSLQTAAGVYRVLMGLAKKSIIADSMTPLTQPLLTPGPPYGSGDYWIAAFAYSVKIYFDFTGYSDIAIGLAELLGFRIVENFDRPYWARNISNFWQRWHISLSSWIRDYLFIPLGGSRRKLGRVLLNLTIVMAIAGLWHGASWHFVVWGLFQGAGLAIHRAYSLIMPKAVLARLGASVPLHYVSVAATFLFVMLGWVLFASPSLATAATVYRNLLP